MSQQGGRPTGPEDDWWGQLYDDSTADTGPAPTADSLDDHFASAAGAVRSEGPVDRVPESRTEDVVRDGREDWWLPEAPAPSPVPPRAAVPPPRNGTPAAAAPGHDTDPAPANPPSTGPTPAFPPEPTADPASAPPTAEAGPARSVGPASAPPTADAGTTQAASPPGPAPTPAPGRPSRPGAPAEPPPGRPPAATAFPPGTPPVPTTVPPGPLPQGFTHQPPAGPPPKSPSADAPSGSASAAPPAPLTSPAPRAARTGAAPGLPALPDGAYVGSRPPTYDAEPTALPPADPDRLDDLVADTVLDGARYGACALRAASVRGDSARYRGEPRRDALLTARFGTGEEALLLVAMATGARATRGAHRAAAEACRWIGRAVGRSHLRLAQDIRAARRGDLKSGLHRLTDRSLGRLRASAAEQGLEPEEYTATLRCLLLPADPECRTRVFFGVGDGGLFRLRGGEWQDIEPQPGEIAGEPVVGFGGLPAEAPEGDRLTMDLGIPTPPSPYDPPPEPPRAPFRFRASVARPGDTLLMCTGGLADPLRGEPELSAHLGERWSDPTPPGLAAFLADTQVRVKGYADDRTAAAVWEA
ncbi:protein phosphatase 2C domain-containing protein [Streptomyces sp. NPDC001381]|uniref:protein phosphatase 2C domain-containing protein n=1 Tax=Streptomyces sp. NPDC001381 TaxID=3364567 RepID=UPI00368CC940